MRISKSLLLSLILLSFGQITVGQGVNDLTATVIFDNFLEFDLESNESGEEPSNPGISIIGKQGPVLEFERADFPNETSAFRFVSATHDLSSIDSEGILAGEPFLIGYLDYENGSFFIDRYSSNFRLNTTVINSEFEEFRQTLMNLRVIVHTTENTSDRDNSADEIFIQTIDSCTGTFRDSDLGTVRVFEGERGRIEVMAQLEVGEPEPCPESTSLFASTHQEVSTQEVFANRTLTLHSFGKVVSNPGSAFFFPDRGEIPDDFEPMDTGDGSFPPGPLNANPSGDLSRDGFVDVNDSNLFRSTLGKCSEDSGFNLESDYDGDGCITFADYRIWYGFYKDFIGR